MVSMSGSRSQAPRRTCAEAAEAGDHLVGDEQDVVRRRIAQGASKWPGGGTMTPPAPCTGSAKAPRWCRRPRAAMSASVAGQPQRRRRPRVSPLLRTVVVRPRHAQEAGQRQVERLVHVGRPVMRPSRAVRRGSPVRARIFFLAAGRALVVGRTSLSAVSLASEPELAKNTRACRPGGGRGIASSGRPVRSPARDLSANSGSTAACAAAARPPRPGARREAERRAPQPGHAFDVAPSRVRRSRGCPLRG